MRDSKMLWLSIGNVTREDYDIIKIKFCQPV